mgnify:FL=1
MNRQVSGELVDNGEVMVVDEQLYKNASRQYFYITFDQHHDKYICLKRNRKNACKKLLMLEMHH